MDFTYKNREDYKVDVPTLRNVFVQAGLKQIMLHGG